MKKIRKFEYIQKGSDLYRDNRGDISNYKLKKYDCTIIITDHSNVNYNLINKHSKMIVDTRNVYKINSKKILKF